MLNRNVAPDFKQVDQINFIVPEARELKNGIKLFTLDAGQQELSRIEFIVENVNWDQNKPLQAVAVNNQINSGTKQFSAKEIAEKVDYYGAFLQTDYSADYITLTLYSLNKHLETVFPIVWSVLNESIFPKKELEIFSQNQQQKLKVNLQKNDFLARKTFANTIFGDTPYGADISFSDYDRLTQDDLLSYYQSAFKPKNCTIIAAGKIGEKEVDLIDQYFGADWENNGISSLNDFNYNEISGSEIYQEKPDAVQSALRLGNLSINRKHVDFPALQITNCVLGGYFGSRLMANIREDKGYTYGIGSGVAALKDAGYFFIATEVGVDVCSDALAEIKKEIDLLRTDLVSDDELQLVRSYMLGSLLGSLENAFSHADKFKNIYFAGLGYDYYSTYIDKVKTITPQEIKETAGKYLNWEKMTKVIVGKK